MIEKKKKRRIADNETRLQTIAAQSAARNAARAGRMRSRTATPQPALRHQTAAYLTSKPSLRRHALCASICAAQASSPNITTHSSRGLRVSAARRGGARRGGAVQARWTESRRAASGTSRRSRRRSSSAAAPNAGSAPGHAQQIFLPLLPTGGAGAAAAPAADDADGAAFAAAELILPARSAWRRGACSDHATQSAREDARRKSSVLSTACAMHAENK